MALFVSLAAVYVSCEVELTSTLPEGQLACPGDEVIFTCTIRGSSTLTNLIISWSSPEYIGTNELLQFTTSNMIESSQPSMINGDVVATLTNNTIINGVPLLESQLQIIANKDFSISTVMCYNWISQIPATVEFYIPGGL